MTPYRVQEADLQIPSDWVDQSLTVFKLPATPQANEASFVMSRDPSKGSRPFGKYVDDQLKQCSGKLPNFALIKNDRFKFQDHAAAWLEFTWHSEKGGLLVRQVFYDRGPQALICTLTVSEEDLKHHDRAWRKVMGTMVLRPPPKPEADDAPPFPPTGARPDRA